MKTFDSLKELIAAIEADVKKVDAGNKAAGTRVRAAMQTVKAQAQQIRNEILDLR